MATEDKSAQRIKENRDPSFTAAPVKENPSGLNTLEYADQDVLDTERPPKIRTTLSPEDFNISDELLEKTLPIFIKKDKMIYN